MYVCMYVCVYILQKISSCHLNFSTLQHVRVYVAVT